MEPRVPARPTNSTPRKPSRRAWRGPLALVLGALLIAACREQGAPTGAGAAPLYRISGKVLKADADDHSGIRVYAPGTSYAAYTDQKGNFLIAGVPPGAYQIQAEHEAYQPLRLGDVALTAGVADANQPFVLKTQTLKPKPTLEEEAEQILSSIMGQALLEDRATSVSGIVVSVANTDFRTVTDAQGQYQILRLSPGRYTLVFEHPGYLTQRVPVMLESGDLVFEKPVILRRAPAAAGQGRVITGNVQFLDAIGQPVAPVGSALVYLDGTARMTVPGLDGAFRFDNLPPARYIVTAVAPEIAARDQAIADLTQTDQAAVTLALQVGEAPTTVPAAGAVSGRVVKDDPQDPLVGILVGLVELGATALTDPTGNYTFANAPPGTYTLVAQAEGYLTGALEEVVIPEGQSVQAAELLLLKRRDFPRVLDTSPAPGERSVLIRETVPLTVRFNKQMRPESLKAAFSITPPVAFTLYAGREHPQSNFDLLYVELFGYGAGRSLHYNTPYTVTITPAAADFEGLHMPEPFRFTFRTGPAAVTGSNPPNGAEDVFVDAQARRVAVFFNARLDPRSLQRSTVRVRPDPPTAVQSMVVPNVTTGWSQMQLSANWQPGTAYTVTIGSGLRTPDGSPIRNLPYTFRFTTSAGITLDQRPSRVVPSR